MSTFLEVYRRELTVVTADIARLESELGILRTKESALAAGIAKREAYELSKKQVSFVSISEWATNNDAICREFIWSKHTKATLFSGLGKYARELGKIDVNFKSTLTQSTNAVYVYDKEWLDTAFVHYITKSRITVLNRYRREEKLIEAPRRKEIEHLVMLTAKEAKVRITKSHSIFSKLTPQEQGIFLRCHSAADTTRVSSYKLGEGTLYSDELVAYVIENFESAIKKYNRIAHNKGFRKL